MATEHAGDDGSGSDDEDEAEASGEVEAEADGDSDFEYCLGVENPEIRPPIHTQEGDTCVFHAICYAAEMEIRTALSRRVPAATTDITFNVSSSVADYGTEIGMNLGEEDQGNASVYIRETTGLKLFRRDGFLARSAAWPDEQRIRLSSYRVHRNFEFHQVVQLIMERRPVIGIMRARKVFRHLGAGDIYDHFRASAEGGFYTHAVVFIGFGVRDGRDYLILANSDGDGFGDNGLGRVYFDSVYNDRFYTLKVTPPRPPPLRDQGQSPSSFAASTSSTFSTATQSNYHVGSTSSAPTQSSFHMGSSSSTAPSSFNRWSNFDVGSTSYSPMNFLATETLFEVGSSSYNAPSSFDRRSLFEVGSTSSTAPSSFDRPNLFEVCSTSYSPLGFPETQCIFDARSTSSIAPSSFDRRSLFEGSTSSTVPSSFGRRSLFEVGYASYSPLSTHSIFEVGSTSSTTPSSFNHRSLFDAGPTSSSTTQSSLVIPPSSTAPSSFIDLTLSLRDPGSFVDTATPSSTPSSSDQPSADFHEE